MEYEKIFFIVVICISVIYTVKKGRENNELKEAVRSILFGFSTILTFFIMLSYYEEFDYTAIKILNYIFGNETKYNGMSHILVIVLMFIVLKLLIQLILMLIQSFAFSNTIDKMKHKKFFVTIFSFIFGIIRGAIFIIVIFIPLILYNNLCETESRINVFTDTEVYKKLEMLIDKNDIKIAKDSIVENNGVTYYNGVTLKEALKSNEEIHNKAVEITKNENTDIEKAKAIYIWVGSNIKYDNNKAAKVMNNDYSLESGAIAAFKYKSGICFDYASLYSVMCRECGLKTKIVIGSADNGEEYVSHSWNKVYVEDEKTWINVDTVYYEIGNYFSKEEFSSDHKIENEIDATS